MKVEELILQQKILLKRYAEQFREVVAERDAAREVLKQLEWVPTYLHAGVTWQCPACHAWKDSGHKDDCNLKEALGE